MASRSLTTAVALAAATFLTVAPAKADVLSIGLDLSGSVPLVADAAFADRVADYLRDHIARLKIGDKVQLRTFGAYSLVTNIRRLDVTISRRDRPSEVAAFVHTVVSSVPRLVAGGPLEVQDETNILGYLDGEARLLSCASEPTEIVLVSDGVENSAFVSGEELISGTRELPEPPADLLAGCSMTILGIGHFVQGATAPFTRELIATWTEWARKAGISSFKALPSF